jgi:hypothetical protein
MEAKSPVAGSREPIFSPLPLLAVVLLLLAGEVFVLLPVEVLVFGAVVSQAAVIKPTAMVAKAKAKAVLIFLIQ